MFLESSPGNCEALSVAINHNQISSLVSSRVFTLANVLMKDHGREGLWGTWGQPSTNPTTSVAQHSGKLG